MRELELRIKELREKGCCTTERLREHAKNQALEIIFHSNKIEGNPLSRGETEQILSQPSYEGLSEKELEAKNLEVAYYWMLEHVESCFDQPEAFIREINKIIVKDIKPNAGQYRTESVSLSGMDFVPPQAGSVPAFMQQLGEEVRSGIIDRSPLEFAASLHTKLVAIHPFRDGNGRTARLLLNACLLAHGLPVVVVNYADRERYLHCLSESNKGDLSSIVEFFIECLEQQFDDFTVDELPETSVDISEGVKLVAHDHPTEPENDVIEQAMREVSLELEDDPLSAVMREKILEHENLMRTEYEAWNQSFLTVLAELKAIVESFNSNERYTRVGYLIRLQEYDLLPFEKYEELSIGKKATRTWFVGLEISGPHSSEKALLFFNRASLRLIQNPKASKVSLVVSRFDGARYQRLDTEPISLREIGYQDGELLFLSPQETLPGGTRKALQVLLAEIIKAYL